MLRSYTVEQLSGNGVLAAFPLVAAAYPLTNKRDWRRFTDKLIKGSGKQSGALVLRRDGNYLCGLLIYQRDYSPWRGALLRIELLIGIDLIDAASAVDALIAAAELTAANLTCRSLQIIVENDRVLASQLQLAGFRQTAQLLSKEVAAPTAN